MARSRDSYRAERKQYDDYVGMPDAREEQARRRMKRLKNVIRSRNVEQLLELEEDAFDEDER